MADISVVQKEPLELTKEEKKKIRTREYMREYMKNKRANDVDFKKKQMEYTNNYIKTKCSENPEYREKRNIYCKERNSLYREVFLKYKDLEM